MLGRRQRRSRRAAAPPPPPPASRPRAQAPPALGDDHPSPSRISALPVGFGSKGDKIPQNRAPAGSTTATAPRRLRQSRRSFAGGDRPPRRAAGRSASPLERLGHQRGGRGWRRARPATSAEISATGITRRARRERRYVADGRTLGLRVASADRSAARPESLGIDSSSSSTTTRWWQPSGRAGRDRRDGRRRRSAHRAAPRIASEADTSADEQHHAGLDAAPRPRAAKREGRHGVTSPPRERAMRRRSSTAPS